MYQSALQERNAEKLYNLVEDEIKSHQEYTEAIVKFATKYPSVWTPAKTLEALQLLNQEPGIWFLAVTHAVQLRDNFQDLSLGEITNLWAEEYFNDEIYKTLSDNKEWQRIIERAERDIVFNLLESNDGPYKEMDIAFLKERINASD
eukprot:3688481-Rhodomonas_salina.1